MKSAHRHELQTNVLAQRLDSTIDTLRPWFSTIVTGAIIIVAAFLIWSYMSSASATRQGDAWNAFNNAVGSMPPNLEEIHQAAQEHPGTSMQELADITWADGQVYIASENYLYNRRAATESLDRAYGAYRAVLQTSNDDRLLNRAHLGLARVYEMRNELDKAREEYEKVGGGYAEFAKQQAERLAEPETKDTYAWLDKAQPPRVQPPAGPGTPGETPAFSADELTLPQTSPDGPAPGEPAPSFDDLLKGLGTLPSETGDQPGATPPAPNTGLPGTPSAPPATGESAPASEATVPATEDASNPPAEGEKSTEADAPATSPADDGPASSSNN